MWKLVVTLRTREDPTGTELGRSVEKICKSSYHDAMGMSITKTLDLAKPTASGAEGLPIVQWMMTRGVTSVPGEQSMAGLFGNLGI